MSRATGLPIHHEDGALDIHPKLPATKLGPTPNLTASPGPYPSTGQPADDAQKHLASGGPNYTETPGDHACSGTQHGRVAGPKPLRWPDLFRHP
jgi:hypothetical protein